jgi:hypothetical protein
MGLQPLAVPSEDEGGLNGLIAAGREAKEIDDRYSVLERFAKPSVVGGVRVLAHECVVDRLIAIEDLAVNLSLVIVPDPAAWLREHRLDGEQEPHLLRLENAALRIDQRDPLAVKDKTRSQVRRGQVIVHLAEPSNLLERRHAHKNITIRFIRAQRLLLLPLARPPLLVLVLPPGAR